MSPEEKRIQELEALLRPFAEAYRLHKDQDVVMSKLKARLVADTSPSDWEAAYVAVYGVEEVKSTEEVV